MTDILSAGLDFEMSFLEELVEDLKGTFHCILHAGKYKDKAFIRDRQKYIKTRYEKGLKNCLSLESEFISEAYDKLQDIFKHYNTQKDIKEIAGEALYNDIMEGITPEEAEDFRNQKIQGILGCSEM
jgi:hypothetical protein